VPNPLGTEKKIKNLALSLIFANFGENTGVHNLPVLCALSVYASIGEIMMNGD